MALQGSLETLYLNSILQMLRTDKKTGLFRAFNGRDEVKIYFSEGDVIYATGSHKNIRLGQLLLREGLLSADQLYEYLKEAEAQGESFGKFLVENRYLSAEHLRKMLHKQTEELIMQLFFWEKGQFEYQDAQINIKGLVIAKINIMKIILEATRKIDELEVLKKHLPADDVILQVSEQINDRKEIKLTTNELQVLTLVDGKQTVGEMIESIGEGPLVALDRFSVYKLIFSLFSSGWIEPVAGKEKSVLLVDSTTLITIYNDILQAMRRSLEKEIGRQTNQVFADCHIRTKSDTVNLLENYDPNEPAATNIQRITEALEACGDQAYGKALLLDQFNRYINNILMATPDLLGVPFFRHLAIDIKNVLQQISDRSSNKDDMAPIFESLLDEILKTGRKIEEKSNT